MNVQNDEPVNWNHDVMFAGALAVTLLALLGCDSGVAKRAVAEQAQAQVRRVVEDLDKRTTETGVYVRVKVEEITENDPWGTRLTISYSQGGVAETVTVRSAGPDRNFHTDDDIVASGMAVNFKGVGEGIKRNAEAVASEAAKGVVKGTVEGVKEGIKDVLPLKWKAKPDSEGATEEEAQPDSDKPEE